MSNNKTPSNLVFLSKEQQVKFWNLGLEIYYVDAIARTACFSFNNGLANSGILPSTVKFFMYESLSSSKTYARFSSPEEMEHWQKILVTAEPSHFCFEIGLTRRGEVIPNKTLIIDTRTGDEIRKLVDEFVASVLNEEEIPFSNDDTKILSLLKRRNPITLPLKEEPDNDVLPPLVAEIDAYYFTHDFDESSIFRHGETNYSFGENSCCFKIDKENVYSIADFITRRCDCSAGKMSAANARMPFIFLESDSTEFSETLKRILKENKLPFWTVSKISN